MAWVDLDPTNNLVVKEEHVVVGWGRDFRDVTRRCEGSFWAAQSMNYRCAGSWSWLAAGT